MGFFSKTTFEHDTAQPVSQNADSKPGQILPTEVKKPDQAEKPTLFAEPSRDMQIPPALQDEDEAQAEPKMGFQAQTSHIAKVMDMFASEVADSLSKQESALRRAEQLRSVLTNMEMDLQALHDLQCENRKLAHSAAEFETQLTDKSNRAAQLDSRLGVLERRHGEIRQRLHEALASLAASRDQEKTLLDDHAAQLKTISALTMKCQNAEEQVGYNEDTIAKLQSQLDEQTGHLAQRERELMASEKNLLALEEKFISRAKIGDRALAELKKLRQTHEDLLAKHDEAAGALENTRHNLASQKQILTDTLKRREEENMSLKTRLEQTQSQLEVKDNITGRLEQEACDLRAAMVSERQRGAALERLLAEKTEQFSKSSAALSQSDMDFQDLHGRFDQLVSELEAARRMNQMQSEKLGHFAVINQSSVQIDAPPVRSPEINLEMRDGDILAGQGDNVEILIARNGLSSF